jgi:hypothetical protein
LVQNAALGAGRVGIWPLCDLNQGLVAVLIFFKARQGKARQGKDVLCAVEKPQPLPCDRP